MGKSAASKQLDEANADKSKYLGKIDSFQYGQQTQGLNNPFSDIKNANAGLTNAFATQGVATGAADYQAQRQDQNQANVLDAIIQGGGGSGSTATALAQQAALGNQQISAGLQQQEQQNQQQAAQGANQVQQLRAQGEGRRQELVAGGKQYVQGLSEQRDAGELAGLGNLYAGAQGSANAALQAKATNQAAIIGGVSSLIGAVASAPLSGGTSLIGKGLDLIG